MLKDISTQCPLQGTEEFHSTQHPWRPGSDAWLASRRKAHWAAEELRDSQVLRLWKLQHPAELVGHCSPCSIEISVLSYSDVWPAAPHMQVRVHSSHSGEACPRAAGASAGKRHVKVTECQQTNAVIFAYTLENSLYCLPKKVLMASPGLCSLQPLGWKRQCRPLGNTIDHDIFPDLLKVRTGSVHHSRQPPTHCCMFQLQIPQGVFQNSAYLASIGKKKKQSGEYLVRFPLFRQNIF